MSATRPGSSAPLSRVGAITGGFVLFNAAAIILWSLPLPPRTMAHVRAGLAGYMIASGLHQNWGMFAPDPMSLNAFVEAEITHRDGRVSVWRFPSTEGTGYYRRYLMERHRKWVNDHVRSDDDAPIWPDAARYAARVNADPANPPTHVRLVRVWSEIQLPRAGALPALEPWHRYAYFDYDVSPGDLQ